MTPTLHIQLLGDMNIQYGQEPVTGVDSPRLQSLLAYLILHRDTPQSRAHLAYLFWLDSTEAQARTNLRKLVYYLRRALPDADRFLHSDVKVLQWRPDTPFTLDILDFEEALARADQAEGEGNAVTLRASLEDAVGLYHGDFLPTSYDDWVLDERERLRQRFARALERLSDLLEGQRDYRAAIEHVQRLLRHDPLHEAAYRRLMRLHALDGDRARALRTYHTCATVLQQELDVEPSAATQAAYQRLLELEEAPVPAVARMVSRAPLVGREQAWTQLQAAWRDARDGRPRCVLVTGEAGIGKTRLAEELLAWAGRQGIATASARCYASEGGLAYTSLATWLRTEPLRAVVSTLDDIWQSEVARLLPELLVERPGLHPPGPLNEGWQRQRLFEALSRPFSAKRQLLLLLDDVQWCDRETLEWLPTLLRPGSPGRSQAGGQLLLVGTMRLADRPEAGPLAALQRDLRRAGQLVEIELGPLDEAQSATLAAHVAGRHCDGSLAATLYRETEGNPLFVIETVRSGLLEAGRTGKAQGDGAASPGWPLPPAVHEAISARLDQLSPDADEMVGLAATIGREFTYDVLSQACGCSERALVRALDELWQRRIVREQGADAYDFSHDKLREVAYTRISAVRRRYLHRRVAEALLSVHGGDLAAFSGQVAAHYELADRPREAIHYYHRAAMAARRVYANQEALHHLGRILELLPRAGGDDLQEAQIQELLGDILALTGEHERACLAYEAASARAPEEEGLWLARLRCQVANAWRSQHRYEEAGRAYRAALRQLGPAPAGDEAAWWQAWLDVQLARADMLYFASNLSEMTRLCEEIGAAVETYGSLEQRANYYSALVMLDNRLGRFRPSSQTLERVARTLALAEETGDQQLMDHKRFSMGFSLLWYGDLQGAEGSLSTALAQAERTGNLPLQDRSLAYLTITHRLGGNVPEVQRFVALALEAATAEQNPVYIGVARANLSWLHHRARDRAQAVREATAALERWRPLSYPMEWLARWPLLAAMLSDNDVCGSVEQARAMLDPAQQRLPEALTTTLEQAIEAWDGDQAETAREHLVEASTLAEEGGYL